MSSQRFVIQRLLKLAYVPPQSQQGMQTAAGGSLDLMALLGGAGQTAAPPQGEGGQAGTNAALSALLGGGTAPTPNAGGSQGSAPQDVSISADEMQQISPDEFTATTPEMQAVLDAMGSVRAALDKLNEAIQALSQRMSTSATQTTSSPQASNQQQPQQPANAAGRKTARRRLTKTASPPMAMGVNLLRVLENLL